LRIKRRSITTTSSPVLIYQDKELLVLAKPPDLHSITHSNVAEQTVSDWLGEIAPEQAELEDGGLVNRLDFETSGLMVAARNQKSREQLRDSFSSDSLKKIYLALVEGKPLKHQELETFLGSRHRGSKKVSVFIEPGRDETSRMVKRKTEIKLLRYFEEEQISLVEVTITRGMRHQIRAHLAHFGHALVGDALYGSEQSLPEWQGLKSRKFFLHSWKVQLKHPVTSEQHLLTCRMFAADIPAIAAFLE